VEPFVLRGQRYLGVGLVDRDAFLGRLPGPKRKVLEKSAALGGHDLNIPVQTLDCTEDELMEAVARLRP
jgi:hypothetical protein